jgi:GPI mannosyltransferase 3
MYPNKQYLRYFGLGVLLVTFRILNALVVRTAFNPDEFWQCGEIAHSLAFGYGHRYAHVAFVPYSLTHPSFFSTWEWRLPSPIRGWTHVLPVAAVYKLEELLVRDGATLELVIILSSADH